MSEKIQNDSENSSDAVEFMHFIGRRAPRVLMYDLMTPTSDTVLVLTDLFV